MGSVLEAFHAGREPAARAALSNIVSADTRDHGSPGLTPKRRDSMTFEAPSAIGRPIANPIIASNRTSRSTIQRTVSRCAPSAIRIPISLVRRATAYDVAPYNPTHAITSDSSANAV